MQPTGLLRRVGAAADVGGQRVGVLALAVRVAAERRARGRLRAARLEAVDANASHRLQLRRTVCNICLL